MFISIMSTNTFLLIFLHLLILYCCSTRKKYLISTYFNDPCYVIPLFHTGHESPESPRIDFFLIGGGGFMRFHFFFSNRDVLRVSPDTDTMLLRIFGIFGESAHFGWNHARIHYD